MMGNMIKNGSHHICMAAAGIISQKARRGLSTALCFCKIDLSLHKCESLMPIFYLTLILIILWMVKYMTYFILNVSTFR